MRQRFGKALRACTVAVALMSFSAASVHAAKVTINLSYGAGEASGYAVLADKFADLAGQYSNASVEVKVRCCGQLVTEDEVFKAMQLGTVDMGIITNNNVSPHFPLMDAFVLPYIFQSKAHTYQVLEGPVGEAFARQLQAATGVHLLTYGFVGDRDFYNSSRPIRSIADMQGLKVRVPKNKVMIETFKAFGAAPIPLSWADTATALQTGTVDGGDNGTSFIKAHKFYEIMPHLAVLEHFLYFSPLFASDFIMKKLDDQQRTAIIKAAAEAGAYHKKIMSERIAGIRRFLTNEGGMQLSRPDKSGFIAIALRLQDRYAAERGGDDFRALLNSIRDAAN